ncbi:hypothetical protein [Microbacterium sp.]|uniref:hypothetical protein n=1 Tax=Microbacterium sp. TaxID=51671 RepID=UPI0025E96539|nr:hypothetical protein [Microbacterium sp.]MBT9605352.1 hypothetical protein [Microbacterium sp.]
MNTSLTRAPQHAASALTLPVVETSAQRRLGPVDRLSLRLGLWLLVHAAARADEATRRAARAADVADLARRTARDRARREADWQRAALHLRPPL